MICLCVLQAGFCNIVHADYRTAAVRGANWLEAHQNPDGSWGGWPDSHAIYTTEAVIALKLLHRENRSYFMGITWLENHSVPNADYQARRLNVLSLHGDDVSVERTALKAIQLAPPSQTAGGWGIAAGYTASPLDTAVVLRALDDTGATNNSTALGYLAASQLSTMNDRGWMLGQSGTSNPWVTANVIETLGGGPNVPAGADLNAAAAVLLSRIGPAAPAVLQARAAVSLQRGGFASQAPAFLDRLIMTQSPDGSWNTHIHDTALAVQALVLSFREPAGDLAVTLPDPRLRQAINAALGRSAMSALDRADLAGLTYLDARNRGITDLTGLQWAVNLHVLDLRNNGVTNLIPLQGLTALRVTRLAGNPVSLPASDPIWYVVPNQNFSISPLKVVSPTDGNVVRVGQTVLPLNLGEAAQIPVADLTQGSVIEGDWPFSMGGGADVTDMPPSQRLLATRFAIPHYRGQHRYYVFSPYGNALVTVDGGPGQVSDAFVAQGQIGLLEAGGDNTIAALIDSDQPVVIFHASHSGGADSMDAFPVAPPAMELWGVSSGINLVTAVDDGTTVDVWSSDGQTIRLFLNAGDQIPLVLGSRQPQGQGAGLHLMADKPIAAIQADDGDGLDATVFMGRDLLDRSFGLPSSAQYIAVVCPDTTPVILSVAGALPVSRTCSANGNFPGKVYFGDPAGVAKPIPLGAIISSDLPVYLMYEDSVTDEERNLTGAP